jgi:uncharacterized protein DUF1566
VISQVPPASSAVNSDPTAKEQAARGQGAREQAAQQARNQAAKEQSARDQRAREQMVREQVAKEQAARDQQAREQVVREQAAKEQAARDQQAREQASKESWTDPATGRMWMKQDYDEDVTWQEATDYCRSLQLAGHSDWRLPTLVELRAIYDASAHVLGHGADPVHYHVKGNLQLSDTIWSSSQGEASGEAWLFNFFLGERFSYPHYQSAGFHALCVR